MASRDPESGHQESAKVTLSRRMKTVSQCFLRHPSCLFKRRSRMVEGHDPDGVINVYQRLMDDLEEEEEPSSGWTKAFVVLQTFALLGLVAALVVTVTVDGVKGRRFVRLRLWQWVALLMVLLSGLSAVRFFTFLVFTPVKWGYRVHRYVVYFLEEIKWSVDVTLWLGLVLVAWDLWFRPRLRHAGGDLPLLLARQTTKLLMALVLGSFLWTLKNALYLKLKADLHYDQLFQRIKRTVVDFHGIQIINQTNDWKFLTREKANNSLKDPSNQWMKNITNEPSRRGKNIWMDVYEMENDTVPIWVLQQLAKAYLKQMKSVGLPKKRDATGDDQKLMNEALQMLSEINPNIDEHSDILPAALVKYGMDSEHLFRLFETQEEKEQRKQQQAERKRRQSNESEVQQQTKVITRDQFLSWAVVAYKNCWGLERTLQSSERVFIKLNRILSTFLLTVMLIIWLLLSTIVDTAQLALLFAPFVTASFIFGDTSKKMFEGLIFTFAMHPFDVGDRVVIENVQMKVTRLNILTSHFFKYDTGEEVVYPNSVLTNTKIINLDITPDQADSLEFIIPSSTPLEDITDLELKIKKALDDDITYSSHTKVVKKSLNKGDIQMVVYFKYLVSYLAADTKASHRSCILTKVMEFTKEMESNVTKASSSIDVGTEHFTLDAKATMQQIHALKTKMLGKYDHESNKEHFSKILMKDLGKEKIKMTVYLRLPKDSKDTQKLKQHVISVIKSSNGTLQDHQAGPLSSTPPEIQPPGQRDE